MWVGGQSIPPADDDRPDEMPIRRFVGATGHLSQAGGRACKVDGHTNALDLGLTKPGKTGELVLVSYIYRGWTGYVRADRVTYPDARPADK